MLTKFSNAQCSKMLEMLSIQNVYLLTRHHYIKKSNKDNNSGIFSNPRLSTTPRLRQFEPHPPCSIYHTHEKCYENTTGTLKITHPNSYLLLEHHRSSYTIPFIHRLKLSPLSRSTAATHNVESNTKIYNCASRHDAIVKHKSNIGDMVQRFIDRPTTYSRHPHRRWRHSTSKIWRRVNVLYLCTSLLNINSKVINRKAFGMLRQPVSPEHYFIANFPFVQGEKKIVQDKKVTMLIEIGPHDA